MTHPPSPDHPARSPGSDAPGPYTQAIRDGKCPLCLGTGVLGPGIICAHTGDLHHPGDPCDLCGGTGTWPPPPPPVPVDQNGMRGWHSR